MSFAVTAKIKRKDWKEDMPPNKYRILVTDAIACAGNANQLSKMLGITRAAVYQWLPRYRADPYMPIKMAVRFMEIPELRNKLREQKEKAPE